MACVYYQGCYEGNSYIVFPAQNGNPIEVMDISTGTSVPVTDQTIIDGVMPLGCGTGIEISDCLTNADGSFSLTLETPDGTKPITIPAEYVDNDLVLAKATTGSPAPFDVTLADGTIVTAGDPLPANVCVTYYIDNDGVYVPGNETIFEITDENHTPEVYLPGEPVNQTITLADGTVLNPGDLVPDKLCIFLELDTAGNIVEQDEHLKSAESADSEFSFVTNADGSITITHTSGDGTVVSGTIPVYVDEDTVTVKYIAGDTLTYDVTLPDGTTIVAGDPIPEGTCLISEENPDGTLVSYNSFQVSDATNLTEIYLPGDTVDYNVTLADGTALSPGDQLPDGICLFLELDSGGNIIRQDEQLKPSEECKCEFEYVTYDDTVHVDGNAAEGDGSTADPIQIPLPDPKAVFNNDLLDCLTATDVLATDGITCGPLPIEDLKPRHLFANCSGSLGTLGNFVAAQEPLAVTMVEQNRGQVADLVVSGQTFLPSAISPLTVTLPPSTPGCLQFVEIGYGGNVWTGGALMQPAVPFSTATANQTGDIANESLVVNHGAWVETQQSVNQDIYAYEVTGTNGGTVDITFPSAKPPNADGEHTGVLHWTVWEACPNAGVLTTANFAAPIYANAEHPNGVDGGSFDQVSVEAAAVDAGDCDALYFGVGRHVRPSGDPATGLTDADSDWSSFDNANVQEITDVATLDVWSSCQMGITAGLIPGGSGPVTFGWGHNNLSGSFSTAADDMASWAVLPLASCEDVAVLSSTLTEKWTIVLESGDCNDSKIDTEITVSYSMVVDPGANICFKPVLNGTVMNHEVGIDNINGTDPMIINDVATFNYCDPNVIPPSTPSTVDVCFQVTEKSGNAGNSSITFDQVDVYSELSHI